MRLITSAEKIDLSSETKILKRAVLDNGIRVLSESIPHVKSVSIGVWIDVGSRDETPQNNGITHFIEHMVFKGTKKRSAKKIAEFIEGIGGYINAFTTKENTCFYVRILSEHLKEGIEVLADIVQNPVFDEREIEKEKQVVYEEINDVEDDYEEYIADVFELKMFYPNSLAFPILGTKETVRSFTRDKLFEHLEKFYTPSRIVITAAGNLEHERLVEYVQKFFNVGNRRKNGFYHRRAKPRKGNATTFVIEKPSLQSHVCLGVLTYGAKDEEKIPLMLLNTLLGDGMSSRLFQKVREKYGLVYSIYSFYSMFNDVGIFGVYFAADKDNVKKTMDIIYDEFENLKTRGISRKELDRAKAQLTSSILIGLESMSNRMQRLAQVEFVYDGRYSEANEAIVKINRVEPEELRLISEKLFRDESFTTVIINPSKNNLEMRK